MSNTLIRRFTSGWTFLRLIRLAVALMIIREAWSSSELLLAIIGGFLMVQAVFNYGCCSTAGCDINDRFEPGLPDETGEETTFIEVK